MFVFNLLLFLIALSLLIFIHELGHFIFAKMFNVYCMEFSLGMGPAVFSKKFKKDPETKYSLRYLPIGGYVAMAGEIEGDEKEKELDIPYERTINGVKAWKRAIITVAGVTFNFIFAIFLIAILIFANGVPVKDNTISVTDDSIAYEAGLSTNDKIVEITSNIITLNGTVIHESCTNTTCNVATVKEMVEIVNEVKPNEAGEVQVIEVKYYHEDTLKSTTLTRAFNTETNETPLFGISEIENPEVRTPSFFEGIGLTFKTFWNIIVLMFQVIGSLFTKEGINQVGGPVQIYTYSSQMASQGFLPYLEFLALISINLGFFNLLPIPGLDGARFYISIVETITNKKLNTKVESYMNTIGILLLFGLMILITIKDVFTLF